MNISISNNQNQVKAKDFAKTLSDITKSEGFALRAVIINYEYADGKKTDKIISISYEVVDPDNFNIFKIKVLQSTPIISQEKLKATSEPVYVSVPLEKTTVTPYRLEYGKIFVSIVAPYIEIASI